MKFVLEIDLEAGAAPDDPVAEVGRILRYWGGNAKYVVFEPGVSHALTDSDYAEVGTLRIEDVD